MRAAVVGGGIGGLATAAALRRVGVGAVVYSDPTPRVAESPLSGPVGELGLGLWTNGLRCLELLSAGAVHRLARHGGSRWMGDASYRTRDGRWIAGPSRPMDAFIGPAGRGEDWASPDGFGTAEPAMLFVSHAHLQQTLTDLLPADAIRAAPSRVSRVVPSGAAMRLEFEDGSATDEAYELLVGADGWRSAVRAQLAHDRGGAAAAQPLGFVVWRGLARGVPLPTGRDAVGSSFQTWGGDGRRFASVAMGDGDCHAWFATLPSGMLPGGEPSLEMLAEGCEKWGAFSEWHDPIPALLQVGDELLDGVRTSSSKR